MREKLKEMAKNGKRFSVRDIIAMKENFMKGKEPPSHQISTNDRFNRPIPSNLESKKNLLEKLLQNKLSSSSNQFGSEKEIDVPEFTEFPASPSSTPKAKSYLMDLIASRNKMDKMKNPSKLSLTTTAAPAKRVVVASKYQRQIIPPTVSSFPSLRREYVSVTVKPTVPATTTRLAEKFDEKASFFKRFGGGGTQVKPSFTTTVVPRTIRTRVVPYTRPVVQLKPTMKIITSTAAATTTQVSVHPETSSSTLDNKKAFLMKMLAKKRQESLTTLTTTTALPATTTKLTAEILKFTFPEKKPTQRSITTKTAISNSKNEFLLRMQSMRNKQPPKTPPPPTDNTPRPYLEDSKAAFFKRLKEQMTGKTKADKSNVVMGEMIDAKRQFFLNLLKQKEAMATTKSRTLPKPKSVTIAQKNKLIEAKAIDQAKNALMEKVNLFKQKMTLPPTTVTPTTISDSTKAAGGKSALMMMLARKRENSPVSLKLPFFHSTKAPLTEAQSEANINIQSTTNPAQSTVPSVTTQITTLNYETQNPKFLLLQKLKKQREEQLKATTTKPFTITQITTLITTTKRTTTTVETTKATSATTSSIPQTTTSANIDVTENLTLTPKPQILEISERKKYFMNLLKRKIPNSTSKQGSTTRPIISTLPITTTTTLKSTRATRSTTTKAKAMTPSTPATTHATILPTFPSFQTLVPSEDTQDPIIRSMLCKLID